MKNAKGWQQIADDLAAKFPRPGRTVRIDGGRKHKGKVGVVLRHVRDKFSQSTRYLNEAQLHLRDMRGTFGFRIEVRSTDGETFWCPAQYAEVIPAVSADD